MNVHTHAQFRVANSPDLHIFGMRESQSTRTEPTQKQRDHANSTQKGLDQNQTQNLFAVR